MQCSGERKGWRRTPIENVGHDTSVQSVPTSIDNPVKEVFDYALQMVMHVI